MVSDFKMMVLVIFFQKLEKNPQWAILRGYFKILAMMMEM